MLHYCVFIINQNGSLVYDNTELRHNINLKSNDTLRLASTFHTMHSISSQITPDIVDEDDYLAGSQLHDGIKTIGNLIFDVL